MVMIGSPFLGWTGYNHHKASIYCLGLMPSVVEGAMAQVANADFGLETVYSARYLKCLVMLVQVFFCTVVYAGHAYFEERCEIALARCLNYNYSNLGVYEVKALKGYSVWTYKRYADCKFYFDGSVALADFIWKTQGIFIRKDFLLHHKLKKFSTATSKKYL